jgi:predicted TIM-barrel fold metal-dependent hydrolase
VDEDRFPLHPMHPYRPQKAPFENLEAFHRLIGIDHACMVAFSVYHDDHDCLLDALSRVRGTGRAVACINPTTVTDQDLLMLHRAGVRGARLNLRTRCQAVDVAAVKLTAGRIRPLGWVLQLYISLEQIAELAPVLPELGVDIVVDHLGAPSPSAGPGRQQPGYTEFIELLRAGHTWTKLSGVYRFSDLQDLDEYVREVLKAAPDRVVWASDWPHSGGVEANPGGDRKKVQEYRKVDDVAWIVQCKQWCRDVEGGDGEQLAHKIWVGNPWRLWQCDRKD